LRSGPEAEETHNHRGNKSLEDSRINRDGLPVGTPAPNFRLPQVAGGELSLDDYAGARVLLVFSDPDCGPCNQLAPELERMQRSPQLPQIVMISRGNPEANRAKVSEYVLAFPVALQRKWEISREYGIFATPVAYLIDEQGIIAADVAVGPGSILSLAYGEEEHVMRQQMQARLEALSKEYERGRAELQQVEERRAFLQETLLRIDGAIQMLRELLAEGQAVEQGNGTSRIQSELSETQ
jgi:peroxiredoxin